MSDYFNLRMLARLNKNRDCKHNQCKKCHGTGTKTDGTHCVHMIACRCSKCRSYQ